MTKQEALKAIKLEGGLLIEGEVRRVAQFFEGLSIAEEALEKQIPKKLAYQGGHEKCPTCGSFYIETYCAKCGQRIDWT